MTKVSKFSIFSAFFPSTAGRATTLESTSFHVPSTTLGGALPLRIVDVQHDLSAPELPIVWVPVDDLHETELSMRTLELLDAGIADVQAGRVRRLDPNEFDDL